MSGPRFRFAPSPTGSFHVGGARTALHNWALARRLGGSFVLRIEDTDEARNRPEWTDGIIDALAWIGISADILTLERLVKSTNSPLTVCKCVSEIEFRMSEQTSPTQSSSCGVSDYLTGKSGVCLGLFDRE